RAAARDSRRARTLAVVLERFLVRASASARPMVLAHVAEALLGTRLGRFAGSILVRFALGHRARAPERDYDCTPPMKNASRRRRLPRARGGTRERSRAGGNGARRCVSR